MWTAVLKVCLITMIKSTGTRLMSLEEGELNDFTLSSHNDQLIYSDPLDRSVALGSRFDQFLQCVFSRD